MNKTQTKQILSLYRKEMARAQRLKTDMLRYTTCAEELQREVDEAIRKAEWIERAINREPDPMNRELLTRKYIYGDTLEEIACSLHYSVRHIQRLLDYAVQELALPTE